jgi:hypothetical protein
MITVKELERTYCQQSHLHLEHSVERPLRYCQGLLGSICMFRICADEFQDYGASGMLYWHNTDWLAYTHCSMRRIGDTAQDAGTLMHFAVLLHWYVESLCSIIVRIAGLRSRALSKSPISGSLTSWLSMWS